MPIQIFTSKSEGGRRRRRLTEERLELKTGKWFRRTILSEGETIEINGAEFVIGRIDSNGKVGLRATPKTKTSFFREQPNRKEGK